MSNAIKQVSLKTKFYKVLLGFERYSFTDEQIRAAIYDFEQALRDLKACQECEGDICKTSVTHQCSNPYWHSLEGNSCTDECYHKTFRAYCALNHKGCRLYGQPTFAILRCPGVEERKEQILESMTSKYEPWWDK